MIELINYRFLASFLLDSLKLFCGSERRRRRGGGIEGTQVGTNENSNIVR
jgi:hypothetical protein